MIDAAGTPAPLVEAHGVEVSFAGKKVLDKVDLAVAPAEIVTVIGPNGAGKSTLARVLLGLIRPKRGTVRRRSGLTIGYVPQRIAIDPTLPLTVRSFLSLPRPVDSELALAALHEVGAPSILERPVQALSGGEVQRMMLARALLRDPELLVLDEPLHSVDFGGQLALFDLIDTVRRRRGCGVLLVSHDLHVVMAGTDRVVCLNRHVCCTGSPESVLRHPEYLTLFGPRAAERMAIYVHAHDHGHDLKGNVTPRAPEDEQAAADADLERVDLP